MEKRHDMFPLNDSDLLPPNQSSHFSLIGCFWRSMTAQEWYCTHHNRMEGGMTQKYTALGSGSHVNRRTNKQMNQYNEHEQPRHDLIRGAQAETETNDRTKSWNTWCRADWWPRNRCEGGRGRVWRHMAVLESKKEDRCGAMRAQTEARHRGRGGCNALHCIKAEIKDLWLKRHKKASA